MSNLSPSEGELPNYMQLYDLVDYYVHENTRFHLVDWPDHKELIAKLDRYSKQQVLEARIETNQWYIDQAEHVSKVFGEDVFDHKVTLESVQIAARQRIAEAEAEQRQLLAQEES